MFSLLITRNNVLQYSHTSYYKERICPIAQPPVRVSSPEEMIEQIRAMKQSVIDIGRANEYRPDQTSLNPPHPRVPV